ncbi:DNA damage-responsive transcriptional repressor RPH1 (JmjC domain-containing protein) [Colletotrichum sojae]|uniref:[histone H3]-trimethyl-L-lysine(9) demethylase n=1 Tax=Colletotrichum sojae TaxID=2175907 RepID=A0A8H6MPF6_9PEZI|nr:DNA damage-responsive transcriptional repressor RPH1 (JmjC domain-containing protein) [Colletotrichum sojae]
MSTDAASAPVAEPAPLPAQSTLDVAREEPVLGQIECAAKPAFLHSPPDSNNAPKSEPSDSELSDLDDDVVDPQPKQGDAPADVEPEEEDIGEVLPDHWSGTVPVFKPTMHQFKDFKLFMTKIDQYGMKSGIVKIIPPSEWKESLPKLDNLVKQVRVREPIKQDIMGSNGTYRQVNIVHGRSYNLPQWRQLCDQSEHQPPARRGERRANVEKPKPRSAARSRPAAGSTPSASKKRGRGRPTRGKAKVQDDEEEEKRPITPVSPKPDANADAAVEIKKEEVVESVEDPGMEVDDDQPPTVGRMGRMGGARPTKPKTQSVSARRKYSKREGSAMIDEEAFKNFDYQMDVSDYTPERCEELERIYWKTLTYAAPLYGADLMGTLFDESTEIWNLNKLPNLLDVLGTKVPGVNTAYLYLGMWKATFAWHLEDVDLYSINYLHFGAPKQWYSISQADARRFEAAMKNIWPTDAKACDQFLRHKGFLISPSHLKQHYNITVNKCVSYPGEFVVTYPYGYHSGYNLGYNCAEAVNFALDSWLPMGKIAKRCECAQAQDSVWVDVYDIERKLRGEETEYEETDEEDEDEDDDEDMEDASGLPSPPNSNTVAIKPSRKRKRAGDKDGRTKAKKIRLKVKTRAEPICCLCPSDIPGAEVLATDDGRKAHRMCALYLPETYIDTVDDKEIIANVANINKERLDLKCLYCRSKKGACFQCSHKKCARAYHATCAAAAGVFVEEAEVPFFGEDGTEYKEQAFEFSCRFHRTKRDKKHDGDSLEDDERIRKAAAGLKKGEICQMQYYKGDIFAGVVVESRADEQTLLVDIIPNGYKIPNNAQRGCLLTGTRDRLEVEWKWLLLPDPADYHLPKASAKAIPMPSSQKAKDRLNAKRPADEVPRKDALFVEGHTWAEFHPCDECSNPNQVKVDFSKDNQMWHYLGKTSTEAKAQYSEDPAKQHHNPKSNYLDTIPKPPKPTSATAAQRRLTNIQPQPSPMSIPGTVAHPSIKTEKPYVYKPRKPVEPTYNGSGSFTLQKFTPKASPAPSPIGQQLHFGSDPGYQMQHGQFVQQRFAADLHHQSAPLYPSVGAGNYSNPNNMQRPSPYGTPGPQSASNGRPGQQMWAAPSQSPRPVPQGPSQGPNPQGHRRYSVAPTPSVAMRYPFFQVHHNRDSKTYRTPYAPWGGFTNGYEGNLRAHLMRTSPEAFFKNNRQVSAGSGSPAPVSSGQPAAPGFSDPHYNNLGNAMPQGSIGIYGMKTPTAAYPSPGPRPRHEQARASYSPMSPSPAPNGSHAGPANYNQGWSAPPASSAPLHPAIRPQYGAWMNQSAPAVQNANHPAQQQQQQQRPQPTRPLTQTTGTQPAGAQPQPVQAKPQTPAKPAAPKVQYKIPEKQTPVPLPAKYLAAIGKLSSAGTPPKSSTQSNGTPAKDTKSSPASGSRAGPATAAPAGSPQGSSIQTNSTSSEAPAKEAAAPVSQVPVPIPQKGVSVAPQRMPFTPQHRQPQPLYQHYGQGPAPPPIQPRPSQHMAQSHTEHHSLNPAEILAQIATQPRVNPPTPTQPYQPMPPSAPHHPAMSHHLPRQEAQYGQMAQHQQQYQAYGPPQGHYQPMESHRPPGDAVPSYQGPQAPASEVLLPEVPANSSAMVERIVQNLRRAASQR